MEKTLGTVGIVGRFKPLHKGAEKMLKTICERADNVIIGIGSANKYDLKNPFTFEETKAMIERTLSYTNYVVVSLDDYGHIPRYADGGKWKEELIKKFGSLDLFVSGNPWVDELLKDIYMVKSPASIIPKDEWIFSKGTLVRYAIAQGRDYEQFLPLPVIDYLKENNLFQRFQDEFGTQTLADDPETFETVESEKEKIRSTLDDA